MKKHNKYNWSVRQAIQERVDFEDMARWAKIPTPKWETAQVPVQEQKKQWSIAPIYGFFTGLVP